MNPISKCLDPADLPPPPGPASEDSAWWAQESGALETGLEGLPDSDGIPKCPQAVRAFAGACYRAGRESMQEEVRRAYAKGVREGRRSMATGEGS